MPTLSARIAAAVKILRHTPFHPQWLLGSSRGTAKWVARYSNGRVLDIGCADRWIQLHLPGSCQYIGLDYPATGGQLYGAHPDVFADASRLPFQNESIDTVVMLEVLEHLRQPREALLEIARVVRREGRVLLSMPFLYPIHDAPHDYQRYTPHGLKRELDYAGLSIDSLRPAMGSAESAGLIACLAMGGMALESIKRRHPSAILVPFLLVAIPVVNLTARLAGLLLPSWPALSSGYQITVRKA